MTFDPSILVILPLLAAAVLLCVGVYLRKRQISLALSDQQAMNFGLRDTEHRLSDLIADLDLRHGTALDGLSQSMNALAASIEWLAGERMIEQAIAMAQSGSGAEAISEEMGMSLDDARTILHFRQH